jgi:hypothetical protein
MMAAGLHAAVHAERHVCDHTAKRQVVKYARVHGHDRAEELRFVGGDGLSPSPMVHRIPSFEGGGMLLL